MNIYLIGYRCCGKTSVGSALAGLLSWDFVDTDCQVTAKAGMDVASIVARDGWQGFRQLESEILRAVCRQQQLVVATGGGIVLDRNNVTAMRQSGLVVWLKASPEVIARRMESDPASNTLRPALTGLGRQAEIRQVLDQRIALYLAAADLELDTGQAGVQELCQRILEYLGRTNHVQ